jgi:hypothetical protein
MYKNFNDMRQIATSSSVKSMVDIIKTISLPLHECCIGPLHKEDRPQPMFATDDNLLVLGGVKVHVGNDGFSTQIVIDNYSLHILNVYSAYVKVYDFIKSIYPKACLLGFKREVMDDLEWLYSPVIRIYNEKPQDVFNCIRLAAK